MDKDIIAIDFGTTHTYVTLCPHGSKTPTSLKFNGRNLEVSTTLLHSDVPDADPSHYPIVGAQATARYGKSKEEEAAKLKYRYESHFKPFIGSSEAARRSTVDFFKALLRDAEKNRLPFHPHSRRVIIGVPSEADDKYCETLKKLADEAGYGDVELIHEPKGAVLHDLANGFADFGELLAGTLVVDFGGGTCDFVYMKHGDIKHSWGDMALGGQLFDDLFYQWFKDQNPERAAELEKSGRDFLARVVECRKCKEDFSDRMNENPRQVVDSLTVRDYGEITNASCEEFEKRARNYSPSDSLKKYCQKFDFGLPERLRNGTVDLISWFEEELFKGLKRMEVPIAGIHVVSLSGGSSLWYFVRDFCIKIFGKEAVVTSPDPYAAISKGLAMLPAIQNEFIEKRKDILDQRDDFIQSTILPNVASSFNESRDEIVEKIAVQLFDGKIAPILREFREKGGTVGSLKQRLENELSSEKVELEELSKKTFHKRMDGLSDMAMQKTKIWLEAHHIRMSEPSPKSSSNLDDIAINPQNPLNVSSFITAINTIIIGISSVIVASICGGTGWALIVAGPGGLIIGFVVAAVAGVAFLFGYKKNIDDFVENNLSIPKKILNKFALTDSKIASCRSKLKDDLIKKIEAKKDEVVSEITNKLEKVIQDEIDNLSDINVMTN